MAEPTIQLGGGNWAGKSGNLLGYYEQNKKFYAEDFTFSRSTTGTYTDKEGYIQEMPYNLSTNSQPTSGVGFQTEVVFQQTDIYDWNGVYYGDNTVRRIAFFPNTTIVGQTYTFSVFVKLTDGSTPSVGNSSTDDFRMWNGAETTNSLTITDLGNGIFRCSVVRAATSINTNVAIEKQTYNSAKTFEVSGYQVNKGTSAKTYFPTTTRLNMPRVDYLNNTNGSLILEPQSTNLVTDSQNYNSTYWGKQRGILSDGGVGLFYLSPTSNVIKYEVTQTQYNQMYYRLPSNVTIGNTYTQQGYVKCDDAPYIHFQVSPITNNPKVVWDNVNKEVITSPSSIDSVNIISLSDGWIKAEITYTASQASIYASIKTYFSTSSSSFYAGVPIGTIAYQTFVQVENLPYATSYIPTSGSSVTRNADACSISNVADRINSSEGVLFAEIARLDGDTSGYKELSISDGTTSNSIKITLPNSNVIQGIVRTNISGTIVETLISHAPIGGYQGFQKIALKYKQNDFALFVNGTKVGFNTNGNTCSEGVINNFSFNRGNAVNIFYGNTKCVAVFKEALTDAELAELTTL